MPRAFDMTEVLAAGAPAPQRRPGPSPKVAVPVLAGSAAYAVTETLEWQSGLDKKLHEAKEFYAIVAIATLGGVVLNFTPIDPIKALFWSAVINGVVAAPVMVLMMHLSSHRPAMGDFKLSPGLAVMGWIATGVMAVAAISLIATWGQ